MAKAICSVESCERPVQAKGLCEPHYKRLWKGQVVDADPIRQHGVTRVCSVPGCERKYEAHGLCPGHLRRRQKAGSLDPSPLADLPGWKGDAVGYAGVHERLRRRGPATSLTCRCGEPAHEWAYDHTDPAELCDDRGPYSTDLSHYMPMCRTCHRTFDAEMSRRRKAVT